MTALIAGMMVIIRARRGVDMLPAASLSAFASAVLVAPWARPFDVGGVEFLWLVLFGTTQFGLGLLLLTMGSRLISATRAALLGNVEVPLGPALVWVAFGEVPAAATLAGGGLVMLAVLGDLAANGLGRRRRTAPANRASVGG
jgi:drug/metabolite transporter (DMT)-like permease